jgi:hypothetical protein
MAYSDYGGYAFRNGQRVEERSDFTISPEGTGFGTPGSWPGFAMAAAGLSSDEIQKRIQWPHYHVVLGDGPIFVGLYKQSSLTVHRLSDEVDLLSIAAPGEELKSGEYEGKRYFDSWAYKGANPDPVRFEVDGHKITAFFLEDDNHYLFVELEQPDGTKWHGWSGYGVGAGLEDAGYGYDTEVQNDRLWEFFSVVESNQ